MPLPSPRNPAAACKNATDGQLYVDNVLIKFHVKCYRSVVSPFDASRRIHRSTNTSSVGCTGLLRAPRIESYADCAVVWFLCYG
jgi:hypothetical protein